MHLHLMNSVTMYYTDTYDDLAFGLHSLVLKCDAFVVQMIQGLVAEVVMATMIGMVIWFLQ